MTLSRVNKPFTCVECLCAIKLFTQTHTHTYKNTHNNLRRVTNSIVLSGTTHTHTHTPIGLGYVGLHIHTPPPWLSLCVCVRMILPHFRLMYSDQLIFIKGRGRKHLPLLSEFSCSSELCHKVSISTVYCLKLSLKAVKN